MSGKEKYPVVPGKWEIPYIHSAGKFTTQFFNRLKEKQIMGSKCSKCNRTLMPPRSFCEKCFAPITEWIELPDSGTIQTFTICYDKFTGLPDPPYALATIRLEGADTDLMHLIGGLDLSDLSAALEKIKVGAKVRAVWSEERKGSILDIMYFEPI